MRKQRGQFTFYRSYYNAAMEMSPEDALAFLKATIEYSMDGKVAEEIHGSAKMAFVLIQPTLDTARKKAEAGAIGGKASKAKSKQTEE